MNRRTLISATASMVALGTIPLVACTTTAGGTSDPADKRREIDAGVDGALSRLYANAGSARELSQRAEGILVFPRVLAAGFLVGGEYGEGALRVGKTSAGYYRTTTASFGLTAGAESKAIVLMFMTPDALQKFQNSSGWTAGVDGSIAVAKLGAGGTLDTQTARAAIIGFVLTNAGLMADLSLEGTKITRLNI
ncbi:BPSL1445 family SYLF domain-containing lipoprotein [Paracidovorax citrulli]